MSVYIGLGSNMGDRVKNIEKALQEIKKEKIPVLKVSYLYESPALLPPNAHPTWDRFFLNSVAKIEYPNKNPIELLKCLQNIEKKLGRTKHKKWEPRIIDLDILLFYEKCLKTKHLTIPHPGLKKRNFVLTPLKEISPLLKIPGDKTGKTILQHHRSLKTILPTWMHIINTTPDSFSDGGTWDLKKFSAYLKNKIHILDIGAESTRPNATPLTPKTEWQRLKPYIELFSKTYKNQILGPSLSIDTRSPQIIKNTMVNNYKINIINDVSGLSPAMLECIKNYSLDYILMHSLSVPASKQKTLPIDKDPVKEIKTWLKKKLNILQKHNISLDRIIFDPGIGFGKTAQQSLDILKRIEEFYCFPLRIMVGSSRKSFMESFSPKKANKRDIEGFGLSLSLIEKKVDILRVHSAPLYARVIKGYQALNKTERFNHF